jgi:hypothetical protein
VRAVFFSFIPPFAFFPSPPGKKDSSFVPTVKPSEAQRASRRASAKISPPLVKSRTLNAKDVGRRYTDLFFQGNLDALWKLFSPALKKHFGNPEGLKQFHSEVVRVLGTARKIVSEKDGKNAAAQIYIQEGKAERPYKITWTLNSQGGIAGLRITLEEAAPTRFWTYRTRTPLRLPFDGHWLVFWGGRSLEQNRHARVSNQRFAYDFVMAREGKTYLASGKNNEDYFCFGKPIHAPAEGTVISAENGIPDNRPGETNSRQILGNHVIIDHHNGEYSFLAHLRQGSVGVKAGDRVKSGDILGQCGNSGNSTEPHLHYHLQNHSDLQQGEGLPVFFTDYFVGFKKISRGEPVKGDTIGSKPTIFIAASVRSVR